MASLTFIPAWPLSSVKAKSQEREESFKRINCYRQNCGRLIEEKPTWTRGPLSHTSLLKWMKPGVIKIGQLPNIMCYGLNCVSPDKKKKKLCIEVLTCNTWECGCIWNPNPQPKNGKRRDFQKRKYNQWFQWFWEVYWNKNWLLSLAKRSLLMISVLSGMMIKVWLK